MGQNNEKTSTETLETADAFALQFRPSPAEERILRMIRLVRFGAVEITIHDARIVQVETREKIRLPDVQPAKG